MTDPFDLKDFSENDDTEAIPLMNIATGLVLPDNISLSLLTAEDTGEALMKDFLENKLGSTTKYLGFIKKDGYQNICIIKQESESVIKESW